MPQQYDGYGIVTVLYDFVYFTSTSKINMVHVILL